MKMQSVKSITKMSLLAKIRQFVDEWQIKASKEKFLILYNLPKSMFQMVGVRVFGDCKLDWYCHLGNCMIAYYVSMVLHTLYYFGTKGQFMMGMRCLCGMGIMVSVIFFF